MTLVEKGLINMSISNMFKVYKQSWFGKLHFQNTVTSIHLFIWLTVKTTIKSHYTTTGTAIYLLGPFNLYQRSDIQKEKKIICFKWSTKLDLKPTLSYGSSAFYSEADVQFQYFNLKSLYSMYMYDVSQNVKGPTMFTNHQLTLSLQILKLPRTLDCKYFSYKEDHLKYCYT